MKEIISEYHQKYYFDDEINCLHQRLDDDVDYWSVYDQPALYEGEDLDADADADSDHCVFDGREKEFNWRNLTLYQSDTLPYSNPNLTINRRTKVYQKTPIYNQMFQVTAVLPANY